MAKTDLINIHQTICIKSRQPDIKYINTKGTVQEIILRHLKQSYEMWDLLL